MSFLKRGKGWEPQNVHWKTCKLYNLTSLPPDRLTCRKILLPYSFQIKPGPDIYYSSSL